MLLMSLEKLLELNVTKINVAEFGDVDMLIRTYCLIIAILNGNRIQKIGIYAGVEDSEMGTGSHVAIALINKFKNP